MKRIREIIADIRNRYPDDDFFSDFESSCRNSPIMKKYYQVYNNALIVLDDESWKILKEKALQHYFDHRRGQKKQSFFNQLNEAFAYRSANSYQWQVAPYVQISYNQTLVNPQQINIGEEANVPR